jgi:hypothetical protein
MPKQLTDILCAEYESITDHAFEHGETARSGCSVSSGSDLLGRVAVFSD